MDKTEIVVVGAGPAGAVAAARLACQGVKVVLLEQKKLPWVKTCGDLVTRAGLEVLAHSGLAEWAAKFKLVDRLRFTAPDKQALDVFLGEEPIARTIPRQQLDPVLVEAALKAGVQFRDETRVQQVSFSNQAVQVAAEGGAWEAQMVILADGSHAPVTRSLGLLKEPVDLIAVRQYLEGDPDPEGALEFHFQSQIIPGYVWMFPLGNGQVNVGAGTYFQRTRRQEVDLRAVVEEFKAASPRLRAMEPLGAVRGHPLHTHLGGTRTHAARLLVAGDAAGLVGPFTGEGISAALCSGEWAAACAAQALEAGDFSASLLASYSRKLGERYLADQRAARLLRTTLKAQGLLNRFIRHLRQDAELAHLFALVYLDEASPRRLLQPANVRRALL